MYIHIVRFEYFNKNDPDTIIQDHLVCPFPTSTEARLYFWNYVGQIQELEFTEVEGVRIVHVESRFIQVEES